MLDFQKKKNLRKGNKIFKENEIEKNKKKIL